MRERTKGADVNGTIAWRLAQILVGLSFVLVVAGMVANLVFGGELLADTRVLAAIVYGTIAIMIIARHRNHTVGWLFVAVAFFSAAGALRVGLSGLESSVDSGQVRSLIALIGHVSWGPAVLLPITLILLYFPDGRLPSPHWWPFALANVIGILAIMFTSIFSPYPGYYFGLSAAEEVLKLVSNISILFLALGVMGSASAIWVRYRRATGREKIQMKWLVYTAFAGILLLTASRIGLSALLTPFGDESLLTVPNPIAELFFALLPSFLAGAIAVAILRHQLFDIDVIIRRTLQYAILTSILALVYFGTVVILQSLFTAVGGQESPIFIVISTLVIAGLFTPLRTRIQDIIDRRFYRKKYEAEQALSKFAAAARDEVDLDKLTASLVDVIRDTVQPEIVSLTIVRKEND